jgi:hypothetical protein
MAVGGFGAQQIGQDLGCSVLALHAGGYRLIERAGHARASLAAIEEARTKRLVNAPVITGIICKGVSPGSVGCTLDALGMAIKLDRYSETATYRLKPWLVKLAVDRMKPNQLSPEEQVTVVASTRTPANVVWPNWWNLRG